MTYEYQTEFTYVADTDPLTGAPVMTAIPQTVRAAKQGIPYNVLSSFGDLFKRENLREAWRLLRKNDPFDYQIQVADAILYSCLNGLGWYFVVQITRQAGKNEISAFLQHYLLLYAVWLVLRCTCIGRKIRPGIQATDTSVYGPFGRRPNAGQWRACR